MAKDFSIAIPIEVEEKNPDGLSLQSVLECHLQSRVFQVPSGMEFSMACRYYNLDQGKSLPVTVMIGGCKILMEIPWEQLIEALASYCNRFLFRHPHELTEATKDYFSIKMFFTQAPLKSPTPGDVVEASIKHHKQKEVLA